MSEKRVPSAVETEYALLGTMLFDTKATRMAIDAGLEEEDFYLEANRIVFRVLYELDSNSKEITRAAVVNKLNDLGVYEKIGGNKYIANLVSAGNISDNITEYVGILRDKTMARRMIRAAEKIVKDGYNGEIEIEDYLDEAEKSVLGVSRSRRTEDFIDSITLTDTTIQKIQKMSELKTDVTGVRTGIVYLDKLVHGLQPGSLNILAARSSMGKTAFAINIAVNVAANEPNKAVAIFSLEQPAEQMELRILSKVSKVSSDKLWTGQGMRNDDWNKLYDAAARLKKSNNIYVTDIPAQKMPDIYSKCRKLHAEKGISLIVVDYLGLIGGGKGASVQEITADHSRNMKALARELNVPVLLLVQVSRKAEERPDKRPMLSDLRDSGAIEQDADVVIMLYREAYYDKGEIKEQARETGQEKLEVNVAKNRNGMTDRFDVIFENRTLSIFNITNKEEA